MFDQQSIPSCCAADTIMIFRIITLSDKMNKKIQVNDSSCAVKSAV